MKRLFFSLLMVICIASSCDKKTTEDQNEQRSFESFNTQLKADMTYTAIVNAFGTPDEDKGSGIHIYVYKLTNGTSIWIGYANKIIYARHVDSNGQVLHTII